MTIKACLDCLQRKKDFSRAENLFTSDGRRLRNRNCAKSGTPQNSLRRKFEQVVPAQIQISAALPKKDSSEISESSKLDVEKEIRPEIEPALKALKWYKKQISPLLPKSCRFLPTCSEYSMAAYKEFGNTKGTILTAWRLIRCNPLNFKIKYQGKFDPPVWPPVGLTFIFK